MLFTLTLVAALASGLVAGIFFAFSNFVMAALARIAPAAGLSAMQSINLVVLNPLFLALFVGTALASLALVAVAVLRWPAPASLWLLAGALSYVVGSFGVTLAFNVPRNDAIARLDAASPASAGAWRAYVPAWTLWNHVRTAASLAAAACFSLAADRLGLP